MTQQAIQKGKTVTGQVTIQAVLIGENKWELRFIKVQRDDHRTLLQLRPDYPAEKIHRASVRAGVHGQDTQRVIIEGTEEVFPLKEGQTFKALVSWNPEGDKAPWVRGVCTLQEFKNAEDERAKADLQHRQQQDKVPSFFQMRAAEQQVLRKVTKKKISPIKNELCALLLKRDQLLAGEAEESGSKPKTPSSLPVISEEIYSVRIYGYEEIGTPVHILKTLSAEWGCDPTEDLQSSEAKWSVKKRMVYVETTCPLLPLYNQLHRY